MSLLVSPGGGGGAPVPALELAGRMHARSLSPLRLSISHVPLLIQRVIIMSSVMFEHIASLPPALTDQTKALQYQP